MYPSLTPSQTLRETSKVSILVLLFSVILCCGQEALDGVFLQNELAVSLLDSYSALCFFYGYKQYSEKIKLLACSYHKKLKPDSNLLSEAAPLASMALECVC